MRGCGLSTAAPLSRGRGSLGLVPASPPPRVPSSTIPRTPCLSQHTPTPTEHCCLRSTPLAQQRQRPVPQRHLLAVYSSQSTPLFCTPLVSRPLAATPLLPSTPLLGAPLSLRTPPFPTMASSLAGMVATAAMSGQEVHAEAADERRLHNSMEGAVPLEGAPAMALPSEGTFLEAGLALARKAVAGMEQGSLHKEGPFLYTGLLGAALLCLRSHEAATRVQVAAGRGPVVAGAPDLLEKAEALVGACEKAASSGRVYYGFFTGQPGVHAVGAAVAAAQGKEAAAAHHMQHLEVLLRSPKLSLSPEQLQALEAGADVSDSLSGGNSDDVGDQVYELAVAPGGVPHEVLYGRTGLLWAALFANKACADAGMPGVCLPLDLLHPIASTVLASGRALAADDKRSSRRGITGPASGAPGQYPPLMWEWHGKRYWGAAHGLAGILHVLLLAHQAGVQLAWRGEAQSGAHQQQQQQQREEACVEDLRGTLRYMVSHRFPSGNFPSAEEGPQIDCRVHWCHGAPGTALTLALFAKSFPSEKSFAAAAEQAGDLVWSRGLLRRQGLCHGISGNAYTFLALSKLPGARSGQRERARAFGAFLLFQQDELIEQGLLRAGDSPFSLMEGSGGPACLFLDLSTPETALFPGYEL